MPLIFPDRVTKNRMIVIEGSWRQNGHLAIMCDSIQALMPDGGCQCFPLKVLEESGSDLLGPRKSGMHDGITDYGLTYFQAAYPSERITKDDLFYYVYGLLHSQDYCERFADNLSRQLPRIPAVKKVADFWAFVEAGRKLGDLHCDFEQADAYPVVFTRGDTSLAAPTDPEKFYRVEQMKFGGKRPKLDKSIVIYNKNITMTGIPLEAYAYVVNGKPALEWVMERQCLKTDKASGIINDSNRYANETAGDPAYVLRLFQRVITVSLKTMEVVRDLPELGDLA